MVNSQLIMVNEKDSFAISGYVQYESDHRFGGRSCLRLYIVQRRHHNTMRLTMHKKTPSNYAVRFSDYTSTKDGQKTRLCVGSTSARALS